MTLRSDSYSDIYNPTETFGLENGMSVVCAVPNCGKKIHARGWCRLHWTRMYQYGRLERVKEVRGSQCKIGGCENKVKGKGFCQSHLVRLRKYGTTDSPERPIRTRHPLYMVWWERKSEGNLGEAWLDFRAFLDDVGERPTKGHYLIRPDRSRPYGKDNFAWYEKLKRQPGESRKDFNARQWANKIDRNPQHEKRRNLERYYGLTMAQYDAKLSEQHNVCAVCKKLETKIEPKTGQVVSLAVDHCHATGDVRGLLCWRCNAGIGRFEDNIELLQSAIDYLKKHQREPA